MKAMAIILSLAISGIALSSDFAPASASKMDGRCCASSDGGRSFRYRQALARMGLPRTCSAYAASCVRETSQRPDGFQMCMAARARCVETGVHVGPYSGYQYAGLARR